MKVRAGFVTNSSSTSYLIIARNDLEEGAFLNLMGVEPDSPIAGLFLELFSEILDSSQVVDIDGVGIRVSPENWFESERLSSTMIERLRCAIGQGKKAYVGRLDSESTLVKSFFCTDAFELENDQIYFNYLECVW